MSNVEHPQPVDPTVEPSILVAAHRHREALAALDRAGGDTSALRLVRVQALLGLERFRAAQELCKKVAWDPASTRSEQLHAHVLGARVLLRNSALVDEALELAVEAAAAATRNSARAGDELSELAGAAHLEAAHGFARKRCRELASREIQEAQKLLPDDGRALAATGYLLLAFDQRALARERFAAAFARGGQGRRLGLLGLCLVDSLAGQFANAHAHLDQLLPLAPDDREALRLRLRLLLAASRWREAVAVLDELLAGCPEADTTLMDRHERATALYQAGHREQSAQAWQQLATDHPKQPLAQSALRHAGLLTRPEAATAPRRRLEAFPSVVQLRNHCGPASVELYLRFFGVPAEQLEVARAIKMSPAGTPLYRMRRFLQAAGFATRRIEADVPQLRRLLDAGIPVILEEDYSQSRHVTVAIGYDDSRHVLAVQDPMSHEVRETPYEQLVKLRGIANNGALVGVPRAEEARLDDAGAKECEYIALVDEAWAAKEAGSPTDGDRLVDTATALRRDYELAWLYRYQRVRETADAAGPGESPARAQLRAVVATIIQLWPDEEWPQQLLGEVCCADRRFDDALRAFEKARNLDPADARNWLRIAECHLAAGREDQAHEALTQTLCLDPGHPRANEIQAAQYLRLGRGTRAWITNEVARELAPANAYNHGVHATLLVERGEPERALAVWNHARQLAPQHLPFLLEEARLLARLARLDEAVQALAGACRERPAEIALRVDLAELLYRHGRPEAALAVCQELRTLDANHPSAFAIGGASRCAAGQLDLGVADLQQALRLRPTFTWALVELGLHLGRAGRHGEAVHACAAAFGLSGAASHELSLAAQLMLAGAHQDAARRARNAVTSGRLSTADWPRAIDLLASGTGLQATHQFLTELERKDAPNAAMLRAHARMLLERFWAPTQTREVLGRLGAVLPEDAIFVAARGAALLDGAADGHAEGERLLHAAMQKEPSLASPRRLLAQRLCTRNRFAEALDVLAACPADFVDAELRVIAQLGLSQVAAAEAIIDAFAAANPVSTGQPLGAQVLRYRLAHHRGDWVAALALAEHVSRASQETEGDGRLDTWEEAKFACLLRLGELDRARHFGEQQASDPASAARLARTALGEHAMELAGHFAALALRMNPNEPLAQSVQAKLTPAISRG